MADIIITNDDLKDPAIDDVVNLQRSLAPRSGEKIADIKTPFFYNPIFYYTLAATIGAIVVWAIAEPFYDDNKQGIPFIDDYLLFGPVAGMLGLSIGTVYGIVNRNVKKMLYCGLVGAGVGMGVTLLTTFIADIGFHLTSVIAVSFMKNSPHDLKPGEFPVTGMAFYLHVRTRYCVVHHQHGRRPGSRHRSQIQETSAERICRRHGRRPAGWALF